MSEGNNLTLKIEDIDEVLMNSEVTKKKKYIYIIITFIYSF